MGYPQLVFVVALERVYYVAQVGPEILVFMHKFGEYLGYQGSLACLALNTFKIYFLCLFLNCVCALVVLVSADAFRGQRRGIPGVLGLQELSLQVCGLNC